MIQHVLIAVGVFAVAVAAITFGFSSKSKHSYQPATTYVKGGPNDSKWEAIRFRQQYSNTPQGRHLDTKRRTKEQHRRRGMSDYQKTLEDVNDMKFLSPAQREQILRDASNGKPY